MAARQSASFVFHCKMSTLSGCQIRHRDNLVTSPLSLVTIFIRTLQTQPWSADNKLGLGENLKEANCPALLSTLSQTQPRYQTN